MSDYFFERTGYVGSYTETINAAIESLETGDCTGVLEEELGYAVIYMKTAHDEELMKSYAYALASDTVDEQFQSLENQWLQTIEVDPENDMEGTVWADYSLEGIASRLENGGVISSGGQ